MNDRTTAIPMSSSRSARRQNETATATATRASVAATSPRLTWIEEPVTRALSARPSCCEHRVHAHGQVESDRTPARPSDGELLGDSALADHSALVQPHDPVGHPPGLVEVVGDEHC